MRLFFVTVLGLGLSACSGAIDVDPDGPVVTMQDLKVIQGDNWKGALAYLDYSSEKRVTIETAATVKVASKTTLKYSVSYPKEPWEDSKSKLKLSQSGRVLDGHEIISRKTLTDGRIIILTSHQGEDNEEPAEILMTYIVGPSNFEIIKDVRFQDTSDFLNRNFYTFKRP